MVKEEQEDKYMQFYQSSEAYLEIKMQRAKIFNKQTNHDMSLRDLNIIEDILKEKFKDYESHSLFADIYELKGENFAQNKKINEFDEYF